MTVQQMQMHGTHVSQGHRGISGMVNDGMGTMHASDASNDINQLQSNHSKRPNTQVHRSGRAHGNSDAIVKDKNGNNINDSNV